MARLYTKTGDKGVTNLYDMRKLNKHDIHFEVLGDLDELSAHIGVTCTYLENFPTSIKILRKIQSQLLDIGSDIATKNNRDKITKITENDVKTLEIYIDEYSEQTPKLTEFILPGYKSVDAHLHVCRTICRRAERQLWGLEWTGAILTDEETFKYMNRLSDFFFAMARLFSHGNEITRSSALAEQV